MSQKTYLQLINKVLLNIRETQVTDQSAPYTQLIGEFVNKAKEMVEEKWRWKALTSTLTFSTVASQTKYALAPASTPTVVTSSGNFPTQSAEVLQDELGNWSVYDVTNASSGGFIRLGRYSSEQAYARNIYLANQAPVQPNAFAYTWGDLSGGGAGAFFYLVGGPTGSRSLAVRMKVPQDEFSTGTEVLLVPWRPVVSFATYLACEDRGEELTERSSLYLDQYNTEVERAMDRDMNGEEGYSELRNPDGGGAGTMTTGFYTDLN